jgi:hypothetical protein
MIFDKIKRVFKRDKAPKKLGDIKVALIADQFTYDSYRYEFDAITINPDDWKEKFQKEKPDIFLCESAWDGHNFEGLYGPWREKIYQKLNEPENRQILFDILDYCRKNSIPTVFWNKEDPPHYRDHRLSYADTASRFDYIFTTSADCIRHYEKDFNHPNVHSLMFAGQPKLFNPLNLSGETIDEVVFAGSYYEDKPERARLMDDIFDRLIAAGVSLRIYDRQHFKNWGNYPERFEEYTLPPIDYKDTADIYRKMNWGLNFNIVTDSETMFARRVFELALSNVYIITNHSVGVSRIFADNIFVFDRTDGLPDFTRNYQEERLNNLYNVLENHTYKNRWKQILDTIGFEYAEERKDIAIIYMLDDEADIGEIINGFNEIDYPDKTLNIVAGKNSEDLKKQYSEIDEAYSDLNQLKRGISSQYWILADENLDVDFPRKAILHYQYLDRSISIAQGSEKFILSRERDIKNKVIGIDNIDCIDSDAEIDVYYI